MVWRFKIGLCALSTSLRRDLAHCLAVGYQHTFGLKVVHPGVCFVVPYCYNDQSSSRLPSFFGPFPIIVLHDGRRDCLI